MRAIPKRVRMLQRASLLRKTLNKSEGKLRWKENLNLMTQISYLSKLHRILPAGTLRIKSTPNKKILNNLRCSKTQILRIIPQSKLALRLNYLRSIRGPKRECRLRIVKYKQTKYKILTQSQRKCKPIVSVYLIIRKENQ